MKISLSKKNLFLDQVHTTVLQESTKKEGSMSVNLKAMGLQLLTLPKVFQAPAN